MSPSSHRRITVLNLINDETTKLNSLKHYEPTLKKSSDAMAYWIKKGLRAPDGTTVRLKAVKIGGWRTSDAWVDEFLTRLNAEPAAQSRQAGQPNQAGAVPAVA